MAVISNNLVQEFPKLNTLGYLTSWMNVSYVSEYVYFMPTATTVVCRH